MLETPRAFDGQHPRAPQARLDAYRWHTGATLRRLAPDETCPILFRDVGLTATARFLRGELRRLAGPLTPITYLRTWRYEEPYVDHEATGRLVSVRPLALDVWHSGVEHVFVADARRFDREALVTWVPGELTLERAAHLLSGIETADEAHEALGGREHRARWEDAARRLAAVDDDLRAIEVLAEPLRRALKSGDGRARGVAEERMARLGATEHDLCAAWHHVPRARRDALAAALREEAAR
jgi:hypothetical protein